MKKYKTYYIAIIIIILITLITGCSSNNISETKYYNILGTITTEELGKPIEGSKVSIAGKTDITDSNGNYSINEIRSGTYSWQVTSDDYIDYSFDLTVNDDLQIDKTLTLITKTAKISGTVNIYNSSKNIITQNNQLQSDQTSTNNSINSIQKIKLDKSYKKDEIIVKYKENTQTQPLNIIEKNNSLQKINSINNRKNNIVKYKVPDHKNIKDLIRKYNEMPEVKWAEPNYILHSLAIPTDPEYGRQWNLIKSNLEAGWDIQQGKNKVIVAVIDTGIILDHPDLENNLVNDRLAVDFLDGNLTGEPSDYQITDSDPTDETTQLNGGSHGTHVSGIIGAEANNTRGISGVNWQVKIMPLRVLDASGYGNNFDIAEAVYFAVDNGAQIINLSLGRTSTYNTESELEKDYLDYANQHNVIVIAAAGNNSERQVMYPAKYDYSIAVGAVDINNNITNYSNTGSNLDLVAPGGTSGNGIYSTWGYYNSGSTYKGYANMAGTSMAAPHVSGLAALLIANGVSPLNVRERLTSTSIDLGDYGKDNEYGYGLIDAYGALLNKRLKKPYVFAAEIIDENITIKSELVKIGTDNTYNLNEVVPGEFHIVAWRDVNQNNRIDSGDYYGKTNSTINIDKDSTFSNINIDLYYLPVEQNIDYTVSGLAQISTQ